MAYAQNTITDVNASNVFVGVLDGLLTAAGWSTVETLTPSGDFRNRIYKSSGASNLCGYDWYIAISWTAVGTANYVRVLAAEAYNPATHVLSGICGADFNQGVGGSGSNSYKSGQPATGWTSPDTLNMASNTITNTPWRIDTYQGGSSNQYNVYTPGFQTLVDSSAFGYWASVTLDHFASWTTVASNVQHCAYSTLALDAAYAASALFSHTPIVDFSQSGFEMSSHYLGVAIDNSHWVAAHATFSGIYGSKLPALTDNYMSAYAWAPYVYLDYLSLGPSNPVPLGTQISGALVVGHVPDMLLCYGGAIGDTITVAAATYVLSGRMLTTNNPPEWQPTVAVLVE